MPAAAIVQPFAIRPKESQVVTQPFDTALRAGLVYVRPTGQPETSVISLADLAAGGGSTGVTGGTTTQRPAIPLLYQAYFDTTLGWPVWWNGANWVNATGVIS